MPNPYKVYDRNQGPGWLKGIMKYVEVPENNPTRKIDAAATNRNHDGDKKLIDDATYVEKGRK